MRILFYVCLHLDFSLIKKRGEIDGIVGLLTHFFIDMVAVQTRDDTKFSFFNFLCICIFNGRNTRHSSSTNSGLRVAKMWAHLTHFRLECLGISASIIF